jgi:hypothetical protein
MMDTKVGARSSGTGLSSTTEPQSSQGLGPSGFDPSRWLPIETAPRDGTIVRLASPKFAPDQPFWWDRKKKRWATIVFAIARKVDAWWAEDEEQPTHWLAVSVDASDSDGSPKGRDAKRLDGEAATARAGTASPNL